MALLLYETFTEREEIDLGGDALRCRQSDIDMKASCGFNGSDAISRLYGQV